MPATSPLPARWAACRVPLCAVTLLTAGLLPVAARADDGIATDRPDFVESSDTVGKGRFQIETSVAFDKDKTAGVRNRTWSTPTLLRWGAWDDVELRLETDGAVRSRVTAGGETARASGFADSSLGIKWHVADGAEDGSRPGMAWLFHVDAPSGSSEFKGEGWRPSARLTAEWDLPHDFSAGVMTGLYQDRNSDNRRYLGGILAATLGIPLREGWRGFVEVAGQSLASNRNGGKVVTFDAGTSWQLSPDLQLDAAVFRGISKAAPDWSWTVGVSVRF
ncbi:Putative MetA-pathway of phenol degradation [Roseateles sp. YR242]|uniref:transporter n=1 Tax=Roseateles sp. YR242 TaxID=1855305 RepID=UPI0008B25D01|nr:transporter [Roseateles sp. YR242]SEK23689.1 Putative MetA-pathway of phenol degradation [Roseateles sp. YR242]